MPSITLWVEDVALGAATSYMQMFLHGRKLDRVSLEDNHSPHITLMQTDQNEGSRRTRPTEVPGVYQSKSHSSVEGKTSLAIKREEKG